MAEKIYRYKWESQGEFSDQFIQRVLEHLFDHIGMKVEDITEDIEELEIERNELLLYGQPKQEKYCSCELESSADKDICRYCGLAFKPPVKGKEGR